MTARSFHRLWGGLLPLALALPALTACSAPHPQTPETPTPVLTPAEPDPIVSDRQILSPDTWTLFPEETALSSLSGDEPKIVDIPIDGLGLVYVMYATCSGDASFAVEKTSMKDGKPTSSMWEVECDSVPTRTTTYTDEDSRTTSLRLVVKGDGPWGFVLANTEIPQPG